MSDDFDFPFTIPGIGGWPSSAEVLAELKRRNPERYEHCIRFSYTPGTGSPATVGQIADNIQAADEQIASGKAREITFDDEEPAP